MDVKEKSFSFCKSIDNWPDFIVVKIIGFFCIRACLGCLIYLSVGINSCPAICQLIKLIKKHLFSKLSKFNWFNDIVVLIVIPCAFHDNKMRCFLQQGCDVLNNHSCNLLCVAISEVSIFTQRVSQTIRRRIVEALTFNNTTFWSFGTIWNIQVASMGSRNYHIEVSRNVLNIKHYYRFHWVCACIFLHSCILGFQNSRKLTIKYSLTFCLIAKPIYKRVIF